MEARYLHPLTEPKNADRLADRLRLLLNTGLLLRSEQPGTLVQSALDAARTLTGAAYGAFYSRVGAEGPDTFRLQAFSGGVPPFFEDLLRPPLTGVLPSLSGDQILETGDLEQHPRFSETGYQQTSQGILHLRSLLAIPVRKRTGQWMGVAALTDPERDAFDEEAASLALFVFHQALAYLETAEQQSRADLATERCEAAEARHRGAVHRLRQVLDSNQLGTWRWDPDSGLLDLDERGAELFGVPPHQPVSRAQLRDHLIFREDLERVPEDLSSMLSKGGKYEAEYRIRDRDGNLRWIYSIGLPTTEETTGRVLAMTGTVQDVTLRKLQEESLRQNEKLAATGRMAATIAHEINNPLEAVTNLIYLAKTDPGASSTVQRLLETADTELARVSQIAQQTLGFYRDTTKPVSIDLNEMLNAVVSLFGRKTAGKRLRVTLDLDPGLTVVGLQGEIRQVVSNLLINAIDASEMDAGPIRIRARRRCRNGCHGVALMISDQGTGIPNHVKTRLFTPFVTTKESRGTGLGLWVTRGMVEKHGGSVRFRSCTNAPTGTVFCVFLPQNVPGEAFTSPSSVVLQ